MGCLREDDINGDDIVTTLKEAFTIGLLCVRVLKKSDLQKYVEDVSRVT